MKAKKACTQCGVVKSLDGFGRSNRTRDGRLSYCRDCKRAYDRVYRRQNAERIAEYNRAYHREHAEEIAERKREFRLKNPKKVKEYSRKWYRANTKQAVEAQRERRRANPEKVAEQNRAWHRANPGRAIAKQMMRRALPGPDAEAIARIEFLRTQPCEYCGASDEPIEIDHIVPIAKGGTNEADNLAAACRECNLRKHAKDADEFLEEIAA